VSDRFAVASESSAAVEAAREVLEAGGSATDAAVAGVLLGCAAHPASCGLGGGGAAIVWDPRAKKADFFDFREVAPLGIRRADYRSKHAAHERRGVMVGVPGLAAGLWDMHQRAGKLPWEKVVTMAADALEQGLPLSAYMAQALVWNATWLRHDERARSLGPHDAEGRVGEKLENPALVKTLRSLAAGGKDAFYSGPIASDVVRTARAAGCRMTPAELGQYRAVLREPLRTKWEGLEVISAPPPSGAGLVVAQLLAMFPKADLRALESGSGPYVHLLSEALRLSYADRALVVGDPAFLKTDVRLALDPEKMRARRARIRLDATTMPELPSISESGTLHFVAIDVDGGVVSVSASLTSMFGAKLVTEGGFALNDALSDFTIDEYGQRVHTRGSNFARGGARPVSSLAPTLVLRGGEPILALGGSGGLRGSTGVLQVLLAHLAFDQPLPSAVAAPRFHVGGGGALKLDPGLAELEADLVGRGEVVDARSPNFSAVTAVGVRVVEAVRVLDPVFDPRKGGAVTVGHGVEPPVVVTKAGARP